MRNLYLTILGVCVFGIVSAGNTESNDRPDENPTNWETGHAIGINMSQIGLKNWSAGGDPSISFIVHGMYSAKMSKNKHVWENNLAGEWGMLKIKGDDFRKNADFVAANTKYGFQIDKVVQDAEGANLPGKWFMSVQAGVQSQFSKTYAYDGDGNQDFTRSKFASPITVNSSIGIDYKPNAFFSLYMSPVAGKQIIVANDAIAARNLHGNNFKNVNNFFGATAIATYTQQVYPKAGNRIAAEDGGDANAVFLGSKLTLFKDYLNGPAQNIDVDWQTSVNVKVARFITASVFMNMIWDYDMDTDSGTDGVQRNVQIKDVIGVGVAYTVGGKKPNLNK
jgi:hypothetical protein